MVSHGSVSSPPRSPRRTEQKMKLESNVTQILSRLRCDLDKIIEKENTEWLKDTNAIIRGYNLGMENVKQLLLEIILSAS